VQPYRRRKVTAELLFLCRFLHGLARTEGMKTIIPPDWLTNHQRLMRHSQPLIVGAAIFFAESGPRGGVARAQHSFPCWVRRQERLTRQSARVMDNPLNRVSRKKEPHRRQIGKLRNQAAEAYVISL
jgi:hypothetical protein